MTISLIKKTFGFVLLSMSTLQIQAQDIIAHQAASDKQMKDISTIKTHKILNNANLNNPATNVYSNWDNASVNSVASAVPSNFKIDLRGFCMPTPSRVVTSKFGYRWHRQHQGLDIKVYVGDTIRAAFDGKIRVVKYDGNGYGHYVVIRHPNGLETLYGHMSRTLVNPDQIVKAGQVIGLGGNTGRSTGSHLHFETRLAGKAIDPTLLFDFPNQDIVSDYYIYRGEKIQKEARTSASALASVANDQNNLERALETAEKKASTNSRRNTSSRKVAQSKAKSYKVKKGDTLYSIAKKSGMSVKELCKKNGIKQTAKIKPGQTLKC